MKKDSVLNDNIDAVNWYYKRDNNYLTYYKVWEEENRAYLVITFKIVDGAIINTTKEITIKPIKDAIKDEAKNN